jgi:hypothetical protein
MPFSSFCCSCIKKQPRLEPRQEPRLEPPSHEARLDIVSSSPSFVFNKELHSGSGASLAEIFITAIPEKIMEQED